MAVSLALSLTIDPSRSNLSAYTHLHFKVFACLGRPLLRTSSKVPSEARFDTSSFSAITYSLTNGSFNISFRVFGAGVKGLLVSTRDR